MLNHSKSLFLSVVIHTLILLSLASVYKYVFPSSKPVAKEHKICVNLTSIKQKAVARQEPKVQQQKPHPKKRIKKPVAQKKVPLKKKSNKEKPKVIKKPVEAVASVEEEPQVAKKAETTEHKPQNKLEDKVINKLVTKEIVQNKVSEEEQYLQDNLAIIAQLIKENLYYPRIARKRGIQGSVTVRFMLLEDATVTQITTISSSSGILTRAAIKTIAELSGKFPKPQTKLMLSVPIIYSLH
jgi:protein TonB